MRASVLKGIGQPLGIEEVPDPLAGPDEAIVRIAFAAGNHRDVWIRKGQYAGLKFPIILGSDGSGEVVEVGGASGEEWLNKQVVINPALHWGEEQKAFDSKSFKILGLPDDGTFAEFVKVPIANLHLKPGYMSMEEAASIPLAAVTAYRALITQGGLKGSEKVLVTGVGSGTGSFAVQIAVALGAEVWVTSGQREKIERARELGAREGVSYKEEGWSKALAQQAGVFDLIVDSAGGPNFGDLVDLAAPGGRIVFFGATAGNPSELPMRKVFWKQLSLLGTTMGSPNDFAGMLEVFAKHRIKPVIDKVFDFDRANEALDRMEAGGQMGKILIRVSGER